MQPATTLRSSRASVARTRRTLASIFAAAVAAGLSAATAFSQGYYPQPNSPLPGNPDLAEIESHLPAGVTLALPAPGGKTVATSSQFVNAVVLAVQNELEEDTPGVTAVSLIREAAQYQPKKAAVIIGKAIPAIVELGGANVDQLLEDSVSAAAAASSKSAPSIAAAAIKAIVKGTGITTIGAGTTGIDDIAAAAVAASQQYAAKTTGAAIKATKGASGTLASDIATAAIQSAFASGGSFLVEEITKSAITSTQAINPGAVAATTNAILNASAGEGFDSVQDVVQIVAAAMAGGGTGIASSLNDLLNTKYAPPEESTPDESARIAAILAASNAAISGFQQARGGAPDAAPANVAAFIGQAGNADNAASIAAGAVAGVPKFAREIVAAAMQAAFTSGSDDSQASIVGAGVRALPTSTAKITTAAINKAEELSTQPGYTANLGAILDAAVRNTTVSLAGSAAFAAMKALNAQTDDTAVRGLVSAAVTAAEGAGYHNAIGDITYLLTRANKKSSGKIVDEAIKSVSISTDPVKVAAAVAGAIAADRKNAATVLTAALAAREDDNDALINAAAAVAQDIIADPKAFYQITNEKLGAVTTADEALAIVHGATMLNPKGSVAIAATAFANSSASVSAILNAASSASWKMVPRVSVALDVAAHVKSNSGSDLFEYLQDQVLQKTSFVADIATGAVAVVPQYAHIAAHAIAFRAPSSAKKAVPALFAFSKLESLRLDGGLPDQPARAAAIMSGLASGIVNARITTSKQNSALRLAVVAAVKASLNLMGPELDQSTGVAGQSSNRITRGPAGVITGYVAQVADVSTVLNPITDINLATVGAVLTAAGKVAKDHVLEIAQAAATAAAVISGAPNAFVGTNIVNALLASKSGFNQTQLQAAVNFGIQKAVENIAGAGADGVVARVVNGVLQYTHSRVTGDPVTSIFEI